VEVKEGISRQLIVDRVIIKKIKREAGMKKLLVVLAALLLAMPVCALAEDYAASGSAAKTQLKEFVVYTDKNARDNHYIPSGWMGDYGDIKLNDQSADNPQAGTTSIEINYSGKKTQNQGWAGV